jgi:DNA repair protein SbcD/Mre11
VLTKELRAPANATKFYVDSCRYIVDDAGQVSRRTPWSNVGIAFRPQKQACGIAVGARTVIRILHTGDWHIGQTLRGFSREREHNLVFEQMLQIVRERQIDAIVIAGDVFDSQNPSGEAHRLFYNLLVRLHRTRPAMTIVVTAGNHDAAGRLEAPRPLLASFGVHVVGNVRRYDGRLAIERHLVPLKGEGGQVCAHVLAVSYPTAACLPPMARLNNESGSPVARAVGTLYEQMFEAARPRADGAPILLTGHLHVAGGVESEGAERRILVGGQHAVPPGVFPAEASYVALGHLHKAQAVGRDTIRYCGSLIPLSATEQPYRHGVTLVTLNGGPIEIEHIPIDRPIPFLRLPATGEVRLSDLGDHLAALDLPCDLPIDHQPFVQVRLAREGVTAGFRAEVDRIAEAFPVRVVDVRLASIPEVQAGSTGQEPLIRLADRDPEDLFRLAFQRSTGTQPEAAHLDVFHRAYAEV